MCFMGHLCATVLITPCLCSSDWHERLTLGCDKPAALWRCADGPAQLPADNFALLSCLAACVLHPACQGDSVTTWMLQVKHQLPDLQYQLCPGRQVLQLLSRLGVCFCLGKILTHAALTQGPLSSLFLPYQPRPACKRSPDCPCGCGSCRVLPSMRLSPACLCRNLVHSECCLRLVTAAGATGLPVSHQVSPLLDLMWSPPLPFACRGLWREMRFWQVRCTASCAMHA